MPLQGARGQRLNTQGVALGYELLGLQPVLEPHAKLDSPSANALQLYKMKLLFVIFLFKKFVLSKNLCIFAATELVCIP